MTRGAGRVLITSHTAQLTPGDHLARLREGGCEVISSPYPRPATEEELLPLLAGVDAVLAGTDSFTRRVFEAAPQLKVVARFGVGYDAIDVQAATEHGVWVTTTPGTNEVAVADLTLGLILALARQIVPLASATRRGQWERPLGVELAGTTLGLIGFGRIGRQVARRAAAFGMEVVVYDLVRDEAAASACGARYVELQELLSESDFVSLHAPSTPETHQLINATTLARMKPSAFLVNTARGELVHEGELAQALREGRLAGAALDVFRQEPPDPANPLLALPNVIPTPHVAGLTAESARRMASLAVDNILAVLRGDRPPSPLNQPRAGA
jgi:D-3-phosphoglycerate dehydrogenase